MTDIDYKIFDNYIEFTQYPYKCSAAYTNKIINASIIAEAVDFGYPNTIRTISNELIFVPKNNFKTNENQFILFCNNNDIPVNKRTDIWDMILTPFLDTKQTNEDIENTYKTLERYGIDRIECNALRQEVSARMISYNFESGLWDWVHLGLFDVLDASCGILSGEKHRLSDKDFELFYFKAMNVALKSFIF